MFSIFDKKKNARRQAAELALHRMLSYEFEEWFELTSDNT